MKRFVCIVCLLALLLSACSVVETEPTIPEDNSLLCIYQLTFQSKLISNDHVGCNWTFTYTHNGQAIQNGHTLTQSPEIFTFQSIDVEIKEKDEIDDVGTGTLFVALFDGGSGKTTVTVTETDGRYKGNTAVWEITCDVKQVCKSAD